MVKLKELNEKELLKELDGKGIDFYLEDDMFELEGIARNQEGKIIIEVISAVSHILEIAGKFLELKPEYKKFYAEKIDKSRTFEMEINRTYKLLKDPKVKDFTAMKEQGVLQFFKKPTDVLVWFDEDAKEWFIELNKINMCFSGDRKSYSSIKELYEDNKEHMPGEWQALYYNIEYESEY